METLQNVVSKYKQNVSKKIEYDYIDRNYGVKSCLDSIYESFNFKKLQIIFLTNLCYLNTNQDQMNKILVGDYKNLFKRKAYTLDIDDIELDEPTIVNNNVVNNITNIITNNSALEEETWDQTDW